MINNNFLHSLVLEETEGKKIFKESSVKGLKLEIINKEDCYFKEGEKLFQHILNKNISISKIGFLLIISIIGISNNWELITDKLFYRLLPAKKEFIEKINNLKRTLLNNINRFNSIPFTIDNYNNGEIDYIKLWNLTEEWKQEDFYDFYVSFFLNSSDKELKIYWNQQSKEHFKNEIDTIKQIIDKEYSLI